MRRTREEIMSVLAELEAGADVAQVVKAHGVSGSTLRRWRKAYGEECTLELAELRLLREENQRLKRIVARQALELDAYREATDETW